MLSCIVKVKVEIVSALKYGAILPAEMASLQIGNSPREDGRSTDRTKTLTKRACGLGSPLHD